jgi:Tfp pilus assembly protein PilO
MKLTKREIFLLRLVAVVAMFALSYYFVIAPEIDKLTMVREELQSKDMEIRTVKAEIESIPQLDEEIQALYSTVETNSERFYPSLLQKKLIVILDQVIHNTGVTVNSLGFSQITSEMGDEIQETGSPSTDDASNNGNQNGTSVVDQNNGIIRATPKVDSMSVTIPLNGTYEQVMDLIAQLEAMNRTIIIDNLQMTYEEDNMISGGMNIEFYALSKLTHSAADLDYLEWPYSSPVQETR